MLSLIICLVIVGWLSVPCNALPGILAPQTSGVDYGPSTAAWTPRPTPFFESVHKRNISLGASSSTSSPAVPINISTTATDDAASLRPATIGGIAVIGALSVVIAPCLLYFFCAAPWRRVYTRLEYTDQPMGRFSVPRSRRRRRVPRLQTGFATAEPKVTMFQVQNPSLLDTFFTLTIGTPRSDRTVTPFKDDSYEYRFVALLTLFGSHGVPLRELFMLASLRVSTNTSCNHWLIDGERGPLRYTIDTEITHGECPFLTPFTREASSIESIEAFQERLVSFGLINIEYQDQSERLSSAQQCWLMDGRIWRINESSSYSSPSRRQLLFEVFSEVFAEIPCKDISPLAERQREIYYYHAHQAMVYLYENSLLPVEHPQNMKPVLVIILQVLSHRFQKHDKALLRLVEEHLPTSGLHPDWNMILLVAQLKATVSDNATRLSHIRDDVFQAVENTGTGDDSSSRAKGLSGWLLVELLDTAEVQECTEIMEDTVRKGKQWMQRLLGSDLSSLEQTMLCRAFARFGTSDDPEPQPRQYDLLFGYHLSRAGCIEKAEKLLSSGLEYYASSPMSTRVWSYRFELVSLILRDGRWTEAEAWLANARKSAVSRSDGIHVPDFWKQSGECGEIFILLGLYQADCDVAMGKLKSAEDSLKDTMERTLFVRDYFIRALRLALRTRLVKVQMWQEVWERATVTAQDLIEDTIASGDCLSTTRSSYSVGILVLTLINKLLWVGDVPGATRLLMSAKRIEDADYRILPLDIELYLKRRRAEVAHLLSIEGSSKYIQRLEDFGADADDTITLAPLVDQLDRNPLMNSSGSQGPTLENLDIQATEAVPSHSGPSQVKHSSDYKWSLELGHARFPGPEVELDDWEIQSHKAKVQGTRDTGNAQTAKNGAKWGRIMCLGTRRGAVHRGDPLADILAQAPHPPTHEPRNPQLPRYHLPAQLE